MSENNSNQDSSAASESRDASMKVDASSLEGDELDFAKEMGFGDDLAPEPEPEPEPEPAEEAQAEPVAAEEEPAEQEASEEESEPAPATDAPPQQEEAFVEASTAPEPPAAAEASEDASEWEEIHPRPSAEGNQALLQTRARELLAFNEDHAGGGDNSTQSASVPQAVAPEQQVASSAPSHFTVDRSEFDALEKERDALSEEYETLNTEHELLLDQHAALNGQLIRSGEETERLKTSLRAARTALTPLPEGERALRAEVLGLRDRLDVAHAENRRRTAESEAAATELAIAQAHFEDRQHEVDVRRDEIADLEREIADANKLALAHTEKQRELLEISSRLQADNNELRSAQVALEETLQARNLEISAREEHLMVTRDGLLARDRQIIDLNALLETTRIALERAETELERRDIDAEQNQRALDRREVRIASLSETLAKIENVMGRRTEPLDLRSGLSPEIGGTLQPSSGTTIPEDDRSASPSESPSRTLVDIWRNDCLSEWMETRGVETLSDYFAAHLAEAFDGNWPEALLIRSLGGVQLDAEIRLIEALIQRGAQSILIEVSDPDADRAEKRAQWAEASGYGEQIQVRVGSLGDAVIAPKADAILLSDALFSRGEADTELESCQMGLSPTGRIFFADQLRGGALTLSPDTLARLDEIWAVLPESVTELPGFSERPNTGDDGGVVAAQGPALDSLFDAFSALEDVGFGHLADLVIGPARGPSLSENDSSTKSLLDSVMSLDESRSITEGLPARHGVAVFRLNEGDADATAPRFASQWAGDEAATDD